MSITTGWLEKHGTSLDSRSFTTYVHEIGHALGHVGNYNHQATSDWTITI